MTKWLKWSVVTGGMMLFKSLFSKETLAIFKDKKLIRFMQGCFCGHSGILMPIWKIFR